MPAATAGVAFLPSAATIRYSVAAMPILEPRKSVPASVHALREIRVEIPFERRGDIMRFYTEAVGLTPWPAAWQFAGGWGAGHPHCGVLFGFRHEPPQRILTRRFVVCVQSLDDVAERLREREIRFERRRGFGPCDESLLVADPAGHLVELRQQRLL